MLPPSLPKPAKAGVRKSSHEFMFVYAYLSTELVPHPNDLAVAASLSQQSLNASRAHSAKDMVSEEYWSSDGAWGAGRGHFPSVANLIVLCWPVEVLCSSFLFRLVAGAWRVGARSCRLTYHDVASQGSWNGKPHFSSQNLKLLAVSSHVCSRARKASVKPVAQNELLLTTQSADGTKV